MFTDKTCHFISRRRLQDAKYINNLIRVLASLSTLRHKFFVSADVCGFIKVWAAQMRPTKVNEFQLDGAISYNSMVEIEGFLPKKVEYKESAIIAVALKSQKVHIILITPQITGATSFRYQILKTLTTEIKPTCLIQLSKRHLAIAVGSLK